MTIAILILYTFGVTALAAAIMSYSVMRDVRRMLFSFDEPMNSVAVGSASIAARMLTLEAATRKLEAETHALYENWRVPNDMHTLSGHGGDTPVKSAPPLEHITPAAKPRRKRK